MKSRKNLLAIAVTTTLASGLPLSTTASASQLLDTAAQQGFSGSSSSSLMSEGKCGEGKCGGDKSGKKGKCGEGKCGGDKSDKEGKCGEGKCGGSK